MSTPDSQPPAARRCRGRSRKLDDAKRRRFCAMVVMGGDLHRAAQSVGCSYPTIRRETIRHPEFREKLRQAREHRALINLLRRSHGDLDRKMSDLEQILTVPPHPPDGFMNALQQSSRMYLCVQYSKFKTVEVVAEFVRIPSIRDEVSRRNSHEFRYI